jgi:hypothetical protein
MIFVVPRCRACHKLNRIQYKNVLVSSILELYTAWLGRWFPPYQRSTLFAPSKTLFVCNTTLEDQSTIFLQNVGSHVPSDTTHIPYDQNPRLTAVKTAKLTWRTWFGKVLLAIMCEDHMYYMNEKCSKVFCVKFT